MGFTARDSKNSKRSEFFQDFPDPEDGPAYYEDGIKRRSVVLNRADRDGIVLIQRALSVQNTSIMYFPMLIVPPVVQPDIIIDPI